MIPLRGARGAGPRGSRLGGPAARCLVPPPGPLRGAGGARGRAARVGALAALFLALPLVALLARRGRGPAAPPTAPLDPGLAYVLQGARGDAGALCALLRATHHPGNCYVLALDSAAPAGERAEAEACAARAGPNVALLPPLPVAYRGVSMSLSALTGLAALLGRADRGECPAWHAAVNLSASDHPVVPPAEARAVLGTARGTTFLSQVHDGRPEERWWRGDRLGAVWLDPAVAGRGGGGALERAGASRPPPPFPTWKGEAWGVLSRAFAERLVRSEDGDARYLLAYFANAASVPEHLPHTALCRGVGGGDAANDHLRFVEWRPGQQHPATLGEADVRRVLDGDAGCAGRGSCRRGALFARKLARGAGGGRARALLDAAGAEPAAARAGETAREAVLRAVAEHVASVGHEAGWAAHLAAGGGRLAPDEAWVGRAAGVVGGLGEAGRRALGRVGAALTHARGCDDGAGHYLGAG